MCFCVQARGAIPIATRGHCRFATEGWIVFRSNRFSFSFISLVKPLRSLSCVASDYSSDSVVCIGILRSLRPLREIKIRAILFCTQRTQRAQSFYSFSCFTLALEWSQTSLRQESAEIYPPRLYSASPLYPPPPPCGVLAPVSGGESG